MNQAKAREIRKIVAHFHPGVVEGSADWKFLVRKYKKEYKKLAR